MEIAKEKNYTINLKIIEMLEGFIEESRQSGLKYSQGHVVSAALWIYFRMPPKQQIKLAKEAQSNHFPSIDNEQAAKAFRVFDKALDQFGFDLLKPGKKSNRNAGGA